VDGLNYLNGDDPELSELIETEIAAQVGSIALVAHASLADPSVLAAAGSVLSNVTAEGYPGMRFHPGSSQFDAIERLAVERAKALFGARYANVQPYSGSAANLAVMFGLLSAGDTILGLDLDSGGHLTHGSRGSVTGQIFRSVTYSVNADGLIDYEQVQQVARTNRPKIIIAGASAYPRVIDYIRLREIADEVGAYLLADISHIAALVAVGVLPSPIDVAHITTTSTYKQLAGPRGGLILMGVNSDRLGGSAKKTLSQLMDRGVFPRTQGTPDAAAIAAKARAFELARRPKFKHVAHLITEDAKALAAALHAREFSVLTGGTDNHLVLVDIAAFGLTGFVAERALEECNVLVNRNRIPGDTLPPLVSSGLRFGTNIPAQRGMQPAQMERCAALVSQILSSVTQSAPTDYSLDPRVRKVARDEVRELLQTFPLPGYPQNPGGYSR
jgi:glycine hydroxymethyltransferase